MAEVSRRGFARALGAALAVALVPGPGRAAIDPAAAARRRLGALARRKLSPPEAAALVAETQARLTPLCGATAPALAALAREDFRGGRTLELGGVLFARAEVASFLAA